MLIRTAHWLGHVWRMNNERTASLHWKIKWKVNDASISRKYHALKRRGLNFGEAIETANNHSD